MMIYPYPNDFKEIGCIVIPKGVSREDFINYCFNRERFWVLTNYKGLLEEVPCLHQVIPDIEFPEDSDSLGSQVLVEYLSDYQQFFIVGTLGKIGNSNYNSEEEIKIDKTYQGPNEESSGNSIGFIGNSLLSLLNIFCKNLNQKEAQLLIQCFGNEESELSLNCSGWTLIEGDSGVKLRYKDEKEILLSEDKIEILFSEKQKLTLTDKCLLYEDGTNKFKIDESGYNLGNINFEKYITKILDFLGNDLILLTSMGPTSSGCLASPSGPKLLQLKTELQQINK